MFRHRSLLFTWVVILSIVMATACSPAPPLRKAHLPAVAPKPSQASGALVSPSASLQVVMRVTALLRSCCEARKPPRQT